MGAVSGRSAITVECSVRSGEKVKEVYRLFGDVCTQKRDDGDTELREHVPLFRPVALASFLLLLLVDRREQRRKFNES